MKKTRLAALTGAVLMLIASAPARAQEAQFVDWASLLPADGTLAYEPSSADECTSGKLSCVDKVIRVMTRRFDDLASSCSHEALFALSYLRTTEEYRRAVTTPGFFSDPAFINHEDAVFAAFYFSAYDAYHRGDVASVPAAWRLALDASRDRAVNGKGSVFLGISAHINRDLPYVLEAIGLVKPDGTSRKPDHDRVNEFLNRVSDDLFPEIARRFDPTVYDGTSDGPEDVASFQAVPAWREQAWRNAERLAAARTPLERAAVEASIEDAALQMGQTLKAAYAYNAALGQSSAQRDAYCAVHHDDA